MSAGQSTWDGEPLYSQATIEELADVRCDICQQPILAGEKSVDDGSELVHAACVAQWFRGNFGREGLS